MDAYYVYKHIDPETNDVVYVGKGSGGRAWDVTRCRSQNKDHQEWMQSLCAKGYTPDEWVEICYKGLTEEEALRIEKDFLSKSLTAFNRQGGENQHQSKMTNKEARWAYIQAVVDKVPHKEIANVLGVSRAAISMIASGKQWKAVTSDLRSKYAQS